MVEEFRTAFRDRWGDGQEVPLLVALDEESGIGFGSVGSFGQRGATAEASPLLEGLPLLGRNERMRVAWSSREAAMLRLYSEAIAEGRTEIPDHEPAASSANRLVQLVDLVVRRLPVPVVEDQVRDDEPAEGA